MSILSAVCDTLEKMVVMTVLHNPGLEMVLGDVTYCRSRDAVGNDVCRHGFLWFNFGWSFQRSVL